MRTFVISCVVAVIVAAGGAFVLDKYQRTAEHAYASSSGTRI